MSFFRITRQAHEDLNNIWYYIALENGAGEAADRLLDRFYEQFGS